MIDIGIFEKIRALKSRFMDGDTSAKEQIASWEKRIQELSLKENFMQHEVTQEAAKILKTKIRGEMAYRLKIGLKDDDRALSDRAEKELRWCLGLFSLDYEDELLSMESLIDKELE